MAKARMNGLLWYRQLQLEFDWGFLIWRTEKQKERDKIFVKAMKDEGRWI